MGFKGYGLPKAWIMKGLTVSLELLKKKSCFNFIRSKVFSGSCQGGCCGNSIL